MAFRPFRCMSENPMTRLRLLRLYVLLSVLRFRPEEAVVTSLVTSLATSPSGHSSSSQRLAVSQSMVFIFSGFLVCSPSGLPGHGQA